MRGTAAMASDQEMREWARANGYSVGERGRLPQHIITAYQLAHYTNGETVTVTTTTEIPNGYCAECWSRNPWHSDDCSRAPKVEPVATTVLPEPAQNVENGPGDSEATITALIRSIAATAVTSAPAVDEGLVRKIAEEVALEVVAEVASPKVYNIHVPGREVVTVDGATHADFDKVVRIVGVGVHAYLVGPPGTGKTTLAGQVAAALSLPFGAIQCDPTMPASKLFGFIDAGGTYRGTVFRDIYQNGGVYLFDEIDNAHPGIIASINGAIANGHCAFPDGMIERHIDFRCVAAANTYGTGATRQFIGRNQLDAATLDRFATVFVDIDETLEEALTLGSFPDNVALAKEWLAKVRGWRKGAADANVDKIISPRASIEGARLLSVGFSMEEAAEMKVWKGTDKATRDKIERSY